MEAPEAPNSWRVEVFVPTPSLLYYLLYTIIYIYIYYIYYIILYYTRATECGALGDGDSETLPDGSQRSTQSRLGWLYARSPGYYEDAMPHVCGFTCVYTYVYAYTYTHTHTYTCTYTYTYTYIYIYIYICR